jgi:hypothetical protein
MRILLLKRTKKNIFRRPKLSKNRRSLKTHRDQTLEPMSNCHGFFLQFLNSLELFLVTIPHFRCAILSIIINCAKKYNMRIKKQVGNPTSTKIVLGHFQNYNDKKRGFSNMFY